MELLSLLKGDEEATSEQLREAISRLTTQREEMIVQAADLYEELMGAQTIALSGSAPSNLTTLQTKHADLSQKIDAAERSVIRLHDLLKAAELREAGVRLGEMERQIAVLRKRKEDEMQGVISDLSAVAIRIFKISHPLANSFYIGLHDCLYDKRQPISAAMDASKIRRAETIEEQLSILEREIRQLRQVVLGPNHI
jgi:DNA-binding transcriptional MerR regulator